MLFSNITTTTDEYLAEPYDARSFSADDYQEDIIKHMRQMEDLRQPSDFLIHTKSEIQWSMRSYLLDFLIEVHQFFQLHPETLFLTINILDRYCSRSVVLKRHYQLVGCVSLLIAAKYGERKDGVPMIKELKDMSCSLYDEQMFLQMEWHVLNALEWEIGDPTVNSFLCFTLTEDNDKVEVEHMARYICEIALFHKEFVSTKPSIMAQTSIEFAKTILLYYESLNLHQAENWTARTLSKRLHEIPQILVKKYSSPHLSCSSIRYQHFLAQQAIGGKF